MGPVGPTWAGLCSQKLRPVKVKDGTTVLVRPCERISPESQFHKRPHIYALQNWSQKQQKTINDWSFKVSPTAHVAAMAHSFRPANCALFKLTVRQESYAQLKKIKDDILNVLLARARESPASKGSWFFDLHHELYANNCMTQFCLLLVLLLVAVCIAFALI